MTEDQRADYRTPQWESRRQYLLKLADYQCQRCPNVLHLPLVAHHRDGRIPGVRAWDHPDEDFEILCTRCHDEEHRQQFFGLWGRTPKRHQHAKRRSHGTHPGQGRLPLKFYGPMQRK